LFILGVVLVIFFVSMGGEDTQRAVESNKLRSGQAMQHHTTTTGDLGTMKEKVADSGVRAGDGLEGKGNNHDEQDKDGNGETNLEETLEMAKEDVEDAAEDQVEQNEKGLFSKALLSMESSIKKSVSKLLGADASGAEVNELTQEVEGALMNNATLELEKRAGEIADNEVNGITSLVDMGEDMGETEKEMEQEVANTEPDALISVRDQVDNAAVDIRQHLRERAANLEKSIMEKRLSERLGRPIKLQIVDGDVEFAPNPIVKQKVPPQYSQQPGSQAGFPQQGGYAQPPPAQTGYYLPPPQQGYQQPPPQGGYQPNPQAWYPQQPYNPQQGFGAQPPPQGNGQMLYYPVPGGAAPAGGYQAPRGDNAYAQPQTIGGVPAHGTPKAVGAVEPNLGAPETADESASKGDGNDDGGSDDEIKGKDGIEEGSKGDGGTDEGTDGADEGTKALWDP
jgi:hypothetical protein